MRITAVVLLFYYLNVFKMLRIKDDCHCTEDKETVKQTNVETKKRSTPVPNSD